MIVVTAAIIEKNGLILAARRKAGSHLAGYWEFPGGKIEAGETNQQCLARELWEEFGVKCVVGNFLGESIYDYGTKIIKLLGYRVRHLGGTFQCREHDRIKWLPVSQLDTLKWAPADIPFVINLQQEVQIEQTLTYYRDNAKDYIRETIDMDLVKQQRQRFLDLLAPNSMILDLGCGSGRDSRFFLDHGHRVTAIDAVHEIANYAEKYINHPVRVQKAQDLDETDIYDGIWACASLLHIPKNQITQTFNRVIRSLKPQGIWYISLKKGDADYQDHKQRFFNNYSLPLLQQLLEQFPQLTIIDISESPSTLRGKKTIWLNVLALKDTNQSP